MRPTALLVALLFCLLTTSCLSPITNLVQYGMSDGERYLYPAMEPGTGILQGRVIHNGRPVRQATVLVAEPEGTPHITKTNAQGRYRLTGIPTGSYVPIVVAEALEDEVLRNFLGLPQAVTIQNGTTTEVHDIQMISSRGHPFGPNIVVDHELTKLEAYTKTSPFPDGAHAQVQHWSFMRGGQVNDTLYMYLPGDAEPEAGSFPLLFAIYPGHSLRWEDISVAFASQGFAVVALSPLFAYGRDVLEHGADARLALQFVLQGALDPRIDVSTPLAMSGSYGSAVLNRLIRISDQPFAAVVLLGGISNAFTGAASFYAGHLDWPVHLGYILASLGTANAKPDSFMQFSPVYSAETMPSTFLIHTLEDTMVPIEQSFEYAQALADAGVPVRTHYFADESHYLKIGEETSDVTRDLFARVLVYWGEHCVHQTCSTLGVSGESTQEWPESYFPASILTMGQGEMAEPAN